MIERVAFSVFGLEIYWYGIVYVIGFLFSYYFILKFGNRFGFKKELLEDIFLWTIVVSVLFGRLFHIVFYDPIYYLNNLAQVIRFDRGGMSIHGGFFGAFLVLWYFSRKHKLNLFKLTDLFVIPAGLGLAFGANFVNQELVGKVTNSIFGVIFPLYDDKLRLPTTIFESIKNMVVFEIILYLFFVKKLNKTPGLLTAWFLILYNGFRFLIDFYRTPDVLFFGVISMGQVLSLIYMIFGLILLYGVKNKNFKSN